MSLFGSKPTAPTPATGFSFGPAPAAAASFGAAPSALTFAPAPSTSSLGAPFGGFGTPEPAAQSASGFWGQQQQQSGYGAATQAAQPAPSSALEDALIRLNRAYQVQVPGTNQPNGECRFKHFFYNMVDPADRHRYPRPPFIDQAAWDQAERDNPQPEDCVPVPVLGFKALHERLRHQQEHAMSLKSSVKTLQGTVQALQQAAHKATGDLEHARRTQGKQATRFLRLLGMIEVLRGVDCPLQPEEVQLLQRLEQVERSMAVPQRQLNEMNSAEMQAGIGVGELQANNQDNAQDLAAIFKVRDYVAHTEAQEILHMSAT
eukprot:TRINITY_DN3293_c0_g1_i1.p1 TRINITY_DN3293_c0_g1~~TRINITY_DN3293_c0_g1_i1.p1  ORF type:complete len:318 (-),score=55.67 TRINITY_DN3293_c0_g1_i1:1518-2471(-)